MNKIGIIFAMKEELDALKEYLEITNEYKIFELNFYEGIINNIKCILVESGVGKVNAARTTQILIDNMDVDCIFNIGVAGGLAQDLNVLDIVVADKLVQHDFDITTFNHEKGYIPNVGKYINCDEYLLSIAKNSNKDNTIKIGTIASGDIFCTDINMSTKINKKFNALAVEMEGASIAQVCFLNHIPFLVIRSISDIPGKNNTMVYEEFLTESSKKVDNMMNEVLKNINLN